MKYMLFISCFLWKRKINDWKLSFLESESNNQILFEKQKQFFIIFYSIILVFLLLPYYYYRISSYMSYETFGISASRILILKVPKYFSYSLNMAVFFFWGVLLFKKD